MNDHGTPFEQRDVEPSQGFDGEHSIRSDALDLESDFIHMSDEDGGGRSIRAQRNDQVAVIVGPGPVLCPVRQALSNPITNRGFRTADAGQSGQLANQ